MASLSSGASRVPRLLYPIDYYSDASINLADADIVRAIDNEEFFEAVERETDVTIVLEIRHGIVRVLSGFRVFLLNKQALPDAERKTINSARRNSRRRLVRQFEALRQELERQSQLQAGDPGRDGLDRLSTYDLESMQRVLEKLSGKPSELKGIASDSRSDKARKRDALIVSLGQIFLASGGEVRANYHPIKGKIDGPFVRFLRLIMDHCPKDIREHLGPGLEYAVRDCLRHIRWGRSEVGQKSDLLIAHLQAICRGIGAVITEDPEVAAKHELRPIPIWV